MGEALATRDRGVSTNMPSPRYVYLAGNSTCRKAACALSTLRVRLASITENELQREGTQRNRKDQSMHTHATHCLGLSCTPHLEKEM